MGVVSVVMVMVEEASQPRSFFRFPLNPSHFGKTAVAVA